MRISVVVLCLLALTAPAYARYVGNAGKNPCDVQLPAGIKKPSVQYSVVLLPQEKLVRICARGIPPGADTNRVLACTFEKGAHYWPVYITTAVAADQQACLLKYEMAHMPPNYWGDPEVELPQTIEWLADRKAALH